MKFFKILKKLVFKVFSFVIKEVLSFIIKFTLFIALILLITGAIVKYSSSQEKLSVSENSYVVIDFSKAYPEKISSISQLVLEENINFYGLLNKLTAIKKDPNIKGIFVKLDGISLDRGQIDEIKSKFLELEEAGKEIVAYATDFNNRNYSLALATDKIFMPPTMSANVNLTGYYSELPYYKGLADKFGVTFNVIHVGDYKSYGENFVKKNMSSEYRENLERLQNKIYSNFIADIIKYRNINGELINSRILDGDFVSSEPFQMQKFNLVDELKYEDEIYQNIPKEKLIPIENYQIVKNTAKDKIAIIYAEGTILSNNEKGGIDGSITVDTISQELTKAAKNKNIKGIVLRINSPGGSALASNLINHKIKEVTKEKPVYISIGGVAASGGYYMAVAGDKIFADKESLTGSIGVVSLIPNINELMKKIDINIESIKKGEYSDLYSLTKEFTDEDEEKIYATSLKVYSEFLDKVAIGRNLDREYVHSIAQGKVWLGEEGKELGLVDEIGGVEECISVLARDMGLNKYDVVEIVETESLDSLVKKYLPFSLLFKELYFKPLYFFPYNV